MGYLWRVGAIRLGRGRVTLLDAGKLRSGIDGE
jgi:hypothetical protein